MTAAGIDSMVLIYAGLVPAKSTVQTAEMKELRIRARILIFTLAEKKATVFLPTVAVTELLVPVPEQQKGLLIAKLEQQFVLPPFDLPAAAIASDLYAKHRQLPQDLQYKDRHVLRADSMIVASAKAAGAVEFYSCDHKCRALANLVMIAKDLPVNSEEWMFLRDDLEKDQA